MSDYGEAVSLEIELIAAHALAIVPLLQEAGHHAQAKEIRESTLKLRATTVTINVEEWSKELLNSIAAELGNDRRARNFVRAVYKMRVKGTRAKVRKLELLPRMMEAYLVEDSIDGWLYKPTPDGNHLAYVVERIRYQPPTRGGMAGYVYMKVKANHATFEGDDDERSHRNRGLEEDSIHFGRDDLSGGRTVAQMLMATGWLKETPELKAQYTAELELFQTYQPQKSAQFLAVSFAIKVTDEGRWWSRYNEKRYVLPHPTKMINDEDVLEREIKGQCYNSEFREYGVKETDPRFGRIPIHPYILFFDLSRHVHAWVHVNYLTPYKYDKKLGEKLVLPQEHRDLIDVLTQDMDVFVEDIIEGKSGGTPILCYGAPGLGKTLTAEVYAETIGRPLYRVAAGQLGVEVAEVSQTLEKVLRRAERWGAVLLLDEADVYVRARGNDIQHNAIVAAFLQTLEYFHGLMFMTTNRAGDVDDAIASRMIAMFKYETPKTEQATKIWTILCAQFGITGVDKLIPKLVEAYPKASGRDIKQLLKLTMKYCKLKKKPMNLEAFRICAMFRGIV